MRTSVLFQLGQHPFSTALNNYILQQKFNQYHRNLFGNHQYVQNLQPRFFGIKALSNILDRFSFSRPDISFSFNDGSRIPTINLQRPDFEDKLTQIGNIGFANPLDLISVLPNLSNLWR